MKKRIPGILMALLALTLALTGCRTRTIANPELADVVLETGVQTPPEESGPEPTPDPPEPTPKSQPLQSEPPEPEPTREAVQLSRPDTVTTAGSAGAEQLQAQTAVDVTVTYDSNGGEGGSVHTVVHTGGPYGVQPEAVRRGYAFAGWWTAPNGGEQVFADTTVTQTEAHTLYAHWQDKRTCTVTFDGNGGRVKSKEARLELSDGDLFGVLPTPLREGYAFQGWFTAPEGGEAVTPESRFSGTDDLTVYADWTYDPYEFWTFTLRNKTQQIYLCQQVSIYVESEQDHVTLRECPLISATGSLNIAENRTDAATTDDWVSAKKPQVVLKGAASMEQAAAVRQAAAARFPDQEVLVVDSGVLSGDGASALYARLALAKHLYGDWFMDVDLAAVADELGVTEIPVGF